MTRNLKICFWCLVFAFFSSSILFADEPAPPQSYKIVTSDQRHEFVMLVPERLKWGKDKNAELAKQYFVSGLYLVGNNKSLWTFDDYSYKVYLSSDGEFLVLSGGWPVLGFDHPEGISKKALEQRALAFYKNGKILRNYSIGDLIKKVEMLPQSVSHFEWQQEMDWEESSLKLTVKTHDGQILLFDAATGKIIQEK